MKLQSDNLCLFFQAEDGIRDAQESRGLGDVYKRQLSDSFIKRFVKHKLINSFTGKSKANIELTYELKLSLIHI